MWWIMCGTLPRKGVTKGCRHLGYQTAFSQALGNRTLLRKNWKRAWPHPHVSQIHFPPPKSHCNNIFSMKNRKQKKPLDSRNSLPQSVILDITKCYPGRSCLYVRDSCKAVVLRVWTQDPQHERLLRPSQTCTLVGPIPGLPN